MGNQKTLFVKIFKGIIVGFGTIIPGLSGGTTAIACGIFEEIMECLSNILNETKKVIISLLPYFIGFIFGVIILSYPLKLFTQNFPYFSRIAFCLITFIGIAIFARNNLIIRWNINMLLGSVLGGICAYVINIAISSNNLRIDIENGFLLILIGLVLALALILPAISFTYLLMYFGLYEKTLNSIINFDVMFLSLLVLGIIIGIILFSKLFVKLIALYKKETYSIILGFTIISLLETLRAIKC